jgi:hypothetical protein
MRKRGCPRRVHLSGQTVEQIVRDLAEAGIIQVKRCQNPECGDLYTGGKSNDRYCSPECKSYAGMKRYRERQGAAA